MRKDVVVSGIIKYLSTFTEVVGVVNNTEDAVYDAASGVHLGSVSDFHKRFNKSIRSIVYTYNNITVTITCRNRYSISAILEGSVWEVAIRRDGKVVYDTPLTNDVIVTKTSGLRSIVDHVRHLDGEGRYTVGFEPAAEYSRNKIVREVLLWLKLLKKKGA